MLEIIRSNVLARRVTRIVWLAGAPSKTNLAGVSAAGTPAFMHTSDGQELAA
jgi:hypothetical protein